MALISGGAALTALARGAGFKVPDVLERGLGGIGRVRGFEGWDEEEGVVGMVRQALRVVSAFL